jgi:hypothetical protein
VRRGEQHAARVGPRQCLRVESVLIDGDRYRSQSPPLGGGAIVGVPGVLEGDRAHALLRQRAQHEVETLREAGADDDLLGIGDRAANPTKIAGEHLP